MFVQSDQFLITTEELKFMKIWESRRRRVGWKGKMEGTTRDVLCTVLPFGMRQSLRLVPNPTLIP
jgi:hypothetical protein